MTYRLKDDPHSSHSVILARLGEGRGRRALDVGAADGFLAERLTAHGWSVTALERDPELAARARGRCKEVVVADLESAPPLLHGPFEAIIYGDVLEHLERSHHGAAGAGPTLAPGGAVIVSVPNVAHLWVRLSLLAGRFDYADRGILDRTAPPLLHAAHVARAPALGRTPRGRARGHTGTAAPGRCRRAGTVACSRGCTRSARGPPGRGRVGSPTSSSRSAARAPARCPACPRRAAPKVVVVMPAYNAARTLRLTYEELPNDTVNLVILVDDGTTDATVEVARAARARDLRPRPQLRLRRQPEDLLHRGAQGGRRHRGDGPSRLSVRSHAGARRSSRRFARGGRRRPGLAAAGRRLRDRAGHAVVEVRLQPLPDRRGEPGLRRCTCPSTTPATARSAGTRWTRSTSATNSDGFVFDQEIVAQVVGHRLPHRRRSRCRPLLSGSLLRKLRRLLRLRLQDPLGGRALPAPPDRAQALPPARLHRRSLQPPRAARLAPAGRCPVIGARLLDGATVMAAAGLGLTLVFCGGGPERPAPAPAPPVVRSGVQPRCVRSGVHSRTRPHPAGRERPRTSPRRW